MRKTNKTLETIMQSLKTIISKLEKTNINWCLVGSLSLYLQDVKIKPNDIDILTDKEGAYKFSNIFKEFERQKVKFRKSDIFYSHYGKFLINGIEVEVMGDLSIFIDGKWVGDIRNRLNSKKVIKYNELEIPVSPLKEQLDSYEKMNRTKDSKKISMINKVLNKIN